MKNTLTRYARAGHAGLFIVTAEEARAEAIVKTAVEELHRPLHAWSATGGLIDTTTGTTQPCPDPIAALERIADLPDDAVILLRDFGAFLEEKDPLLHRQMRDTLRDARTTGKLLVLLGVWKPLAPELEREITRIDLALPGSGELDLVLNGLIDSAGLTGHSDLNPVLRESALAAAGGLTTLEAENAFALSVIESGTITPARPPMRSRLMMRLTNSSSVLVVLSFRSSLMSPLSMLPLKGGLASTTS